MSRTLITLLSLATLTLPSIGCDNTTSPTAPSAVTAPSAEFVAMLSRAIDDEYRAETIYQGVIDDFGQILPFVNVLTAETRHSAAIGRLYLTRGLAVPASRWTTSTVPHFAHVAAACTAAAAAERENIVLYDELLRGTLPDDVRQVFTTNRSASLLNHLPAFERCAG